MSEYRKELEKYLTMPNAHINCAENTSMALTDALGIGGGLEDARYMAAFEETFVGMTVDEVEDWVKGQPDGCKDLMRRACDLMEELLRERGL